MSKITETNPKGAGRKRIKFNEEDYMNIERWSGDGLSEAQIATMLGCSLSTIARNKRTNDKFGIALKKGKVRAIQAVANQVFENAMSGKETSAIFFLKNRDPENWSDRAEVNHNLNLKEVLNIAKNRVIEGSVDYNKLNSQHVLTKDTLPED
jgi:hypothetical protein